MVKKKCKCVCEREGSPSEQYADNEGNGKWRQTIGDCGGGSDGIGGRKREPIAAFPEHGTVLACGGQWVVHQQLSHQPPLLVSSSAVC